jgi:hypothetical protein
MKSGLEFFNFGYCNLFEICDLEFVILIGTGSENGSMQAEGPTPETVLAPPLSSILPSSVICHLSSVVCPLSSVTCLLSSVSRPLSTVPETIPELPQDLVPMKNRV